MWWYVLTATHNMMPAHTLFTQNWFQPVYLNNNNLTVQYVRSHLVISVRLINLSLHSHVVNKPQIKFQWTYNLSPGDIVYVLGCVGVVCDFLMSTVGLVFWRTLWVITYVRKPNAEAYLHLNEFQIKPSLSCPITLTEHNQIHLLLSSE